VNQEESEHNEVDGMKKNEKSYDFLYSIISRRRNIWTLSHDVLVIVIRPRSSKRNWCRLTNVKLYQDRFHTFEHFNST